MIQFAEATDRLSLSTAYMLFREDVIAALSWHVKNQRCGAAGLCEMPTIPHFDLQCALRDCSSAISVDTWENGLLDRQTT